MRDGYIVDCHDCQSPIVVPATALPDLRATCPKCGAVYEVDYQVLDGGGVDVWIGGRVQAGVQANPTGLTKTRKS